MTNGYLMSTTLILLIAIFASVSEGGLTFVEVYRVKFLPAYNVKEDEERFGENEEDVRKRMEHEEKEAQKHAEQTEFTKFLAQNFSTQMESMMAKVNKQWMEAMDAKFATQTQEVKAYLEASKKEIASTIFALKSTIITNHQNEKKRFDLLLTLGKNSIDLVTEVKSNGNTGVVNLTNLIKEQQQGKGMDAAVAVLKNSVAAIQGNVHTFYNDFCELFQCKSAKVTPEPKVIPAPAQEATVNM